MFVMLDPLAEIERDDLAKELMSVGQSYHEEFDKLLPKLEDAIASANVLHLLSALAVHGLFGGMSEKGERRVHDESTTVQQPQVELAQALALRIPMDGVSWQPAVPAQIQEIWDLLLATSKAFDLKRFIGVNGAQSKTDEAVLLLQERLRIHTHRVRNWGYHKQVIEITKALYGPLDRHFVEQTGLSATQLIDLFDHLLRRLEHDVSHHLKKLGPALQATSAEEAARKYYKAFPDLVGDRDDLVLFFRENRVPLEAARSLVLSHAGLRLTEFCMFSVETLSQQTGLPTHGLARALPKLSMHPGELEGKHAEFFFLDNPVWLRPMIRLDESYYFCATPQVFFSWVLDILDGLLSSSADAAAACQRRRSEFLESSVEEHMLRAFPGCAIASNVKWHDSDTEYETDLLVKVDSYLLIVEAKSGAVSRPALRGAPERARRHVEELLVAPALQSQRLAERLEAVIGDTNTGAGTVPVLPFDLTNVHRIVRLSVTLEDFATIQSNVRILGETGWLPNDLEVAPTMCLADLAVVLDTLSSAPERIHYLVRRAELERHMKYVADEMDLLGLYLQTAFCIGEVEFKPGNWLLTGMSQAVDDYYVPMSEGIRRDKPLVRSTKWWADIRSRIEERRPPGWSEVAVMLLNVSLDEQRTVRKGFNEISRKVRLERERNRQDFAVLLPPHWRDEAFAAVAFRDEEQDARHSKMQRITDRIFSESHATRCLVLAINVDRNDYPYTTLGVYDRDVVSGVG